MTLRDLDPDAQLGHPARKQRYVNAVFDTVAPSYDRFTRRFSFGMDARWKRQLVSWAAAHAQPGDLVADFACGTGDVTSALTLTVSGVRVVGVDPNAAMLRIARARSPSDRPTAPLVRGDLLAVPLAARSVAVATVAYGFRNVPDASEALVEVARVLQPGGWLLDLDFFVPERPVWRRVFQAYLRTAGRAVGAWWHGDPEAYGYVARSLERWVTPTGFQALLGRAGFRVAHVVRHLHGGICLHGAIRMSG